MQVVEALAGDRATQEAKAEEQFSALLRIELHCAELSYVGACDSLRSIYGYTDIPTRMQPFLGQS